MSQEIYQQPGQPEILIRANYQPSPFSITHTELTFKIFDTHTVVYSKLSIQKDDQSVTHINLDGENLELLEVHYQNRKLLPTEYLVTSHQLIIPTPDDLEFTIQTQVKIEPHKNTALEGLYLSQNNLVTQCEPQGFRKITYFLDRPDVMSRYTTHIIADKNKYPFLLSNGDLVNTSLNGEIQTCTWVDPHPKPCYLFALVAGDFDLATRQTQTRSNKPVTLKAYVPKNKGYQAEFALKSLESALKWDELRYDREYDLNTYMIVSTDDFNAGAMENKGLNIFNSRLILADPQMATDSDYLNIESVIAHEYFHNWTGNRVTLRDWFNLTLKEGLTVFRDQQFTMDKHSYSLTRIDTVSALRLSQFAEDAGPNAHPIYPKTALAVDNFFTSTIYEKGSEVIGMLHTLFGADGFKKGMDLYFKRHDGQAVTIEKFAKAIFDANSGFISEEQKNQFSLWYSQSGTPTIKATTQYDQKTQQLLLNLEQIIPQTPKGDNQDPFLIPLAYSFIDATGNLVTPDTSSNPPTSIDQKNQLLLVTQKNQTYFFDKLPNPVHISLNQGFSAPIRLEQNTTQKEKILQAQFAPDLFNRWDAIESLYVDFIREATQSNHPIELSENFIQMIDLFLNQRPPLDTYFLGYALKWPSYSHLAQTLGYFDAPLFLNTLTQGQAILAQKLMSTLYNTYTIFHNNNDYIFSTELAGQRFLKNKCLGYLSLLPDYSKMAWNQFINANHMTDEEPAFQFLLKDQTYRDQAIEKFYKKWAHSPVTLNKWFSSISSAPSPHTNTDVKKLWTHPDFIKTNPNRVYSLLRSWTSNLTHFHNDISNYDWISERLIELDAINPQVAARIGSGFDFCIFTPLENKKASYKALSHVLSKKISPNLYEGLSKTHQQLEKLI